VALFPIRESVGHCRREEREKGEQNRDSSSPNLGEKSGNILFKRGGRRGILQRRGKKKKDASICSLVIHSLLGKKPGTLHGLPE